jgi:O-antigen/teichoic acid export membrane protein
VQAILAAIAGPSAVGAYAAVRTLTQPVGTLIQAIDTVDKPRAGRAYAERGINGLWVVIRKSWAWLIALSLPYLVAISYFSSEVLAIAYGDRYADVSGLVVLWSAVMLVMLFTQPLETGLYVIRRPDLLFKGRAVSAVLVLSATPFLISAWSASGALSALILGWSLAGLFAGLQLIAARTGYKK